MPTYNFARYLPEAIESVLAQTFADYEFIIIDDGSRDPSAEVIKQYAERDRRIRFSVNERNLGMVQNWNRCLEQSRGEYIKFLFGDDLLSSPDAIGRMVSVLDQEQNTALVASARYHIDEKSRIIGTVSHYAGKRRERGVKVIQGCLLEQKNDIGEPSVVLFRKKHAGRGFDTRYKQLVDLEMWFHVLEQGDFAYLDDPLCSFRVHPEQQTRANIENSLATSDVPLMIRAYSSKQYIHYSLIMRAYMLYHPVYAVWKRYSRHGLITRKDALNDIHTRYHYSAANFFAFMPVFKAIRSLRAMKQKLQRFITCKGTFFRRSLLHNHCTSSRQRR